MTKVITSQPQQIQSARERLVKAVRRIYRLVPKRPPVRHVGGCQDGWYRRDFIWDALLLSASTWGGTRGAELIHNKKLHGRVKYAVLEKCRAAEREKILRDALQEAKVNYAPKKVRFLLKNFALIKAAGGPAKVKQQLILCEGRDAKIKFLKKFHGIGPKYARNLMMDVYHPEFRDSIALDVRVSKFLRALGVTFLRSYRDQECFFVAAAHKARLNGWELDRMLFSHTDCLLAILEKKSPR
jgi:hypothetical protein